MKRAVAYAAMSQLASQIVPDLRRYSPGVLEGVPQSVSEPPTLIESESYCRRLATSHYENFPLIARLLPRDLRQPFFNVYAYCRWSDDLGDELGDRQLSTRLLGWWRGELARCWAGEAMTHPVFVALQQTAKRFDLAREPFDDLLTAFEQDQVVTEYQTFDELLGYCSNSANPVGRIVLRLCGADDERSVELSDSVCTGLQLANFWQDVARDADIGRTYLPIEDCERFGYSRHDLAQRITNDAFLKMMQFQVERARGLLLSVRELAPRLTGRLQRSLSIGVAGRSRLRRTTAYLGTNQDWVNRYGEANSIERLALTLTELLPGNGPCLGTHTPYAIAFVLRVDEQAPVLSQTGRDQIKLSLLKYLDILRLNQRSNGAWGKDWTIESAQTPGTLDASAELLATGHHLEWLALLPQDIAVPADMVRRAVEFLVSEIKNATNENLRTNYTAYSHAGCALRDLFPKEWQLLSSEIANRPRANAH